VVINKFDYDHRLNYDLNLNKSIGEFDLFFLILEIDLPSSTDALICSSYAFDCFSDKLRINYNQIKLFYEEKTKPSFHLLLLSGYELKLVVEYKKHFLYYLHHVQLCFVLTIDHNCSHHIVPVQMFVSRKHSLNESTK
jgi:hypothetical protein